MTDIMKKPERKLGKALSAATLAYLLCSIFGCALYMVLPPVLSSVGARFHAYLLLEAATDKTGSFLPIVWTVLAHVYVLVQVVLGFVALKTGKLRAYSLVTAVEVLLTVIYLGLEGSYSNWYTAGFLVNLVYCAWLFRVSLPKKNAAN